MKRLVVLVVILGTLPVFAQKAFEGTWRLNMQSGQFKGADKYLLKDGVWHCESCVPKEVVKADGQPHKVVGQPYHDTVTVKVVGDREIEMTTEKNGKPHGTTKMTVSEDDKVLTTDATFISENGTQGHVTFTSDRIGGAPASGNKVSGTWQARKMENASENVMIVKFEATEGGLSMSDQFGDSYDAKFDGKDYPYKGDPGTTSVVLKKINENTIEETDKRNGKVITVARMTVSPDGKTMKFAIDDKLRNQQANWTAEKQ